MKELVRPALTTNRSVRICIITAGHLATCPRMVKAADAMADAGYSVRVVSSQYVDWATRADADVIARRASKWQWTPVAWGKSRSRCLHVLTGVRFRATRGLAYTFGAAKLPFSLLARAHSRACSELVAAALLEPADLYYGGGSAFAATALAARAIGVPYALDLEDFHSAEQLEDADGRLSHALVEQVERRTLHGAAFLTAGSDAIGEEYERKYGMRPITINNVMPLPVEAPPLDASEGKGLRLYWFSQTIGPQRGLEEVVRAIGLADIPCELTLRGRPAAGFLPSLESLALEVAPRLCLIQEDPAPPDMMIPLAYGMDVGLASEIGFSLSNQLQLSNKVFTYINAGLAVACSDTPGQRALAHSLGEGACLYQPEDVTALAAVLTRWATDKALLTRAKTAAWKGARSRWHWEHECERGTLLAAVAKVCVE